MNIAGAMSMAARRRNRKGFTIIELLTVIGIILFLMAFLAGVFLRYTKQAKVKATQKLLERIGIGLERYYADFRSYPPDTGYGLAKGTYTRPVSPGPPAVIEVLYDTGSLWRYLGMELVKRRTDGTVEKNVGPYVDFRQDELNEYTDGAYPGKSYFVVDAYNNPVGYVGHPYRVMHKRGEFDLFSPGEDKKTGIDFGGTNDAYNTNDDDGDGVINNGSELGGAADNGTYTSARKDNPGNKPLDDVNNWDPQGQ
jgi:prepilin-type N-terminal cleavage/methylation domain-containing protein